jgi:hypothetical protein
MKCQRCWSDQEPAYRVFTDALNIKVCATCAKEALDWGLLLKFLLAENGEATWNR